MEQKELKNIIINLWPCVNKDKFKTFLWNQGLGIEEINKYIKTIENIYYNRK